MLKRTVLLCLLCTSMCWAKEKMAFTVSMPQPSNHTYHVTFRCEGLQGELQDFKMPQWSPGYYGIGDYARYVSNFHAVDRTGHELVWEKVTKNTWRVVADNAPGIVVDYDVFGNTAFSANNYLGEDRGYLSPSGLLMNLAGHLQHPVTLAIHLPPNWTKISTGLEAVNGQGDTFEAPDFDVLYDSPILIGNQERLEFEANGVPHYVAVENVPAEVDRTRMAADLKTMVTAANPIDGPEMPYKHYTFLMMGRGGGGIEHANSSSNQFDGTSLTAPARIPALAKLYLPRILSQLQRKAHPAVGAWAVRLRSGKPDQHAVGVGRIVGLLSGSCAGARRTDDEGPVSCEDGDRHRNV